MEWSTAVCSRNSIYSIIRCLQVKCPDNGKDEVAHISIDYRNDTSTDNTPSEDIVKHLVTI